MCDDWWPLVGQGLSTRSDLIWNHPTKTLGGLLEPQGTKGSFPAMNSNHKPNKTLGLLIGPLQPSSRMVLYRKKEEGQTATEEKLDMYWHKRNNIYTKPNKPEDWLYRLYIRQKSAQVGNVSNNIYPLQNILSEFNKTFHSCFPHVYSCSILCSKCEKNQKQISTISHCASKHSKTNLPKQTKDVDN